MKFNPAPSLCFLMTCLLLIANSIFAQDVSNSIATDLDTLKLSKKEKKALKKKEGREYIQGRRWRISTSFIFASINSSLELEGPLGILGAQIRLEDQLGFKSNLIIPKFDLQYSFTLHSSLYAEYYNIIFHENPVMTLTRDLIGEILKYPMKRELWMYFSIRKFGVWDICIRLSTNPMQKYHSLRIFLS